MRAGRQSLFVLVTCVAFAACGQSPTAPSAVAPSVPISASPHATADAPPELSFVPPRALGVTRFMAFGDSITSGTLSSFDQIFVAAANGGFPERLQIALNAAHAPQTFQVINQGMPAEAVAVATSRFRSSLSSVRPEVVLLLEGINDLSGDVDPIRVASLLFGLVDIATAQGVPVLVATMYQTYSVTNPLGELRPNGAATVGTFNAEVRRLSAGRLNVHLVDLEPLMRNRSILGGDGLHPTDAGYQVIANAFQQRIETAFPVRGSFQ